MKTPGNATTAARRRRRRRRVRDIGLSGVGLLILAFIWQVIAWSDRATSSFNRPLLPGWHYLFTTGFLSLSSYAPGNSGVSLAPPTYISALRALAYQGAYTWARTLLGLFAGLVVGASGGLLMGWFPITRRIFLPAVTFIRMVPALALLPLFGLWFGLNDVSAVVYISFTVGVLYFVMTLSAVGNVPVRYSQWARTLGASRRQVYRTVILPAIFPEFRAAMLLAVGGAWTSSMAAEFIGVNNGWGRVAVFAQEFAETGQMLIVTLAVVCSALLTYGATRWVLNRWSRWIP